MKGLLYIPFPANMPELPEVETVRQELEEQVLKRPIDRIEVRDSVVVRNPPQAFVRQLKGLHITAVSRIGKLLRFHLSNEQLLLAHLKMTGQFLFVEKGSITAGIYPLLYISAPGGKKTAGHFREQQGQKALNTKHIHVVFHFTDGTALAFRDQRKFGYLQLVEQAEAEVITERYGIDPLLPGFTEEAFQNAFKGRKKSLKAVLMDQQLIAGLGNIYADEICHRVGIRPQRSVRRLSKKQLSATCIATKEIMEKAIAHKGTTFRDFTRTKGESGDFLYELLVYGRANSPCQTCNTGQIKKVQYLGRGTHYCTNCQQ